MSTNKSKNKVRYYMIDNNDHVIGEASGENRFVAVERFLAKSGNVVSSAEDLKAQPFRGLNAQQQKEAWDLGFFPYQANEWSKHPGVLLEDD